MLTINNLIFNIHGKDPTQERCVQCSSVHHLFILLFYLISSNYGHLPLFMTEHLLQSVSPVCPSFQTGHKIKYIFLLGEVQA